MLTGLVRRPDAAGAPAPEQVHLQFGADASRQVAVSWAAPAAVARPRLRFGQAGGAPGSQADADERTYTDALTGETVWTYHARIGSLEPDCCYGYEVLHDGAPSVHGTFRTAPLGRSGRSASPASATTRSPRRKATDRGRTHRTPATW